MLYQIESWSIRKYDVTRIQKIDARTARSMFNVRTGDSISAIGEYMQKQSFTDVFQNRCSLKFHKFHRKTPVLESFFNKVVRLKACSFINKRLQHSCFPVKFVKFLRTSFLQKTSRRYFCIYRMEDCWSGQSERMEERP